MKKAYFRPFAKLFVDLRFELAPTYEKKITAPSIIKLKLSNSYQAASKMPLAFSAQKKEQNMAAKIFVKNKFLANPSGEIVALSCASNSS